MIVTVTRVKGGGFADVIYGPKVPITHKSRELVVGILRSADRIADLLALKHESGKIRCLWVVQKFIVLFY